MGGMEVIDKQAARLKYRQADSESVAVVVLEKRLSATLPVVMNRRLSGKRTPFQS